MRYILGIDIGASKISLGLVSNGGKVFEQKKFLTEMHRGKIAVLQNISSAIGSYPRSAYRRIGIGIIGAVDWRKGISITADKFPRNWRNVPVGRHLRSQFRVPVHLDNDANAFAVGAAVEKAPHAKGVFGLTVGSGIGGGFVMNGRIWHGRDNWASEIGHTTIDENSTIRCSCGQVGHSDVLAGGWGIERQYAKRTGRTASARQIEIALQKGDRAARTLFQSMTNALGVTLANIVAMYNPEVICIGGGLSRFKDYIPSAVNQMKKRLHTLPPRLPKILLIRNPEAANIRGAAFLTFSKYHSI